MSDIVIFPPPQHLERGSGHFALDADTRIIAADAELGELLAGYLRPATGFALPLHPPSEQHPPETRNAIHLTPADPPNTSPEAYRLQVSPQRITLAASAAPGFVHAMQTLRQLLPPQILRQQPPAAGESIEWQVPALSIDDAPAFGWRGLHLDVGRHLFPLDFIKKFIDLLALYKLNTFHWHLTEDQGWRIEISKYPELTEIGAYRRETPIPENRHQGDGKPYGGFYTQAQIREIVDYASQRQITVIPEIELPGHSVAALAAYPHLGCVGRDYEVRTTWGIAKDILCAGSDEVFRFLKDVLSEVLDLFPSPFIHIGGDEAPKDRWRACPACQNRIQTEGLRDEYELQSWFIRQIESWLNERGRQLVGWDEILEGGLAPNATVMSWRGSQGGIDAANSGHNVVMSPNTYCYFDYYQGEDLDSEPAAIGGYLPLKYVYQFDVIPAEIAPDKTHHILGGQGNVWTEYIPTAEQVEYMAYPRALALAEVLWTHPTDRDYDNFEARLKQHLPHLDSLDVHYRPLGD